MRLTLLNKLFYGGMFVFILSLFVSCKKEEYLKYPTPVLTILKEEQTGRPLEGQKVLLYYYRKDHGWNYRTVLMEALTDSMGIARMDVKFARSENYIYWVEVDHTTDSGKVFLSKTSSMFISHENQKRLTIVQHFSLASTFTHRLFFKHKTPGKKFMVYVNYFRGASTTPYNNTTCSGSGFQTEFFCFTKGLEKFWTYNLQVVYSYENGMKDNFSKTFFPADPIITDTIYNP